MNRWKRAFCGTLTAAALLTTTTYGQTPTPPSAPPPPPYAAILKDAKEVTGLMTLHRRGESIVAELSPGDYGSEFLILMSIGRGIGMDPLLGGMTLNFGNDWVFQFRKLDDKIHVVRKNVRFRANGGTPESNAVRTAYTDSVLFSLPIMAKGPKGGDLVDFSPIFMSDLAQISSVLPGFAFSPQKSTIASMKGFEQNMEIEIAATYASGGQADFDTVPDSRGVTINMHYSITKVPQTSYSPRLADDRVGYFLTVVKDFSTKNNRDNFVRYINRWNLQKADSSLPVSVPAKPIKFWLEKTVPFRYRQAIRDGITEWNKAYLAAGFSSAIEVEQQPDKADWDPEDVRYNSFRWITSEAGFAMGPSRVNPYTGEILDADIIFDADFLTFWKEQYETVTPKTLAEMIGQPYFSEEDEESLKHLPAVKRNASGAAILDFCMLSRGMSSHMAFGAAAIDALAVDPKTAAEQQDKMILQGLKEVTMHEVGHTLGLRHNFKASKMLSIKDLNDPAKANNGQLASVMDYAPPNIVPKEWQHGDYFTGTVGPYDIWAIQYGYTPFPGGTQGEVAELKKIASRSGEPQLAYATDEDTRGSDIDPDSNRFDLGSDPVEYARLRAQVVSEALPGIVERMTKEGDDYTLARRALSILLSQHSQGMFFASRYVGGIQTSRSHKGDKDAKAPLRLVDANLQRDVLKLLDEQVFSDKPFSLPPETYNYLTVSNWNHWGSELAGRKDFAVHQVVARLQDNILSQLMSANTLNRIHDSELKAAPEVDVFTTAELIEKLTRSIYSEVESVKEGEFTNRKPAISSTRRDLQRRFLVTLSNVAMGNTAAPADCQTIAFAELGALNDRIKTMLAANIKFDSYTKAHLSETQSRIQKVLEAKLSLTRP